MFGGVKFDVALGAVSIFVRMADDFLLPGFSVQFYGMNLSVNIENTLFSFSGSQNYSRHHHNCGHDVTRSYARSALTKQSGNINSPNI